ncbi:hypothetical protein DsansV1_C24g0180801 [Dioscorea sansibarensis]
MEFTPYNAFRNSFLVRWVIRYSVKLDPVLSGVAYCSNNCLLISLYQVFWTVSFLDRFMRLNVTYGLWKIHLIKSGDSAINTSLDELSISCFPDSSH